MSKLYIAKEEIVHKSKLHQGITHKLTFRESNKLWYIKTYDSHGAEIDSFKSKSVNDCRTVFDEKDGGVIERYNDTDIPDLLPIEYRIETMKAFDYKIKLTKTDNKPLKYIVEVINLKDNERYKEGYIVDSVAFKEPKEALSYRNSLINIYPKAYTQTGNHKPSYFNY